MLTETEPRGLNVVDVVSRAVTDLSAGRPIIVHDDGICLLAIAAEHVNSDHVNLMARDAGGVVSTAMAADRVDALGLEVMGGRSGGSQPTVSVDATEGTTGISTSDRAAAINALCSSVEDGRLVSPGHVVPLRVAPEDAAACVDAPAACVALANAAGILPVIATCAILDESGEVLPPQRVGEIGAFRDMAMVSTRATLAHRRGLSTLDRLAVEDFREVMTGLVTGVAAITVRDSDGLPKGLLATAVTSYSDQPPSLLICVAHSSRTHDPLRNAPGFGVHLLSEGQQEVAMELAGKSDEKFTAIDWGWDGDVPRIDGAAVYLRCLKSAEFVHADHSILIGEIEVAESLEASPLVYFQRSFGWQLGDSGPGR